jgi:hypothetical protein
MNMNDPTPTQNFEETRRDELNAATDTFQDLQLDEPSEEQQDEDFEQIIRDYIGLAAGKRDPDVFMGCMA